MKNIFLSIFLFLIISVSSFFTIQNSYAESKNLSKKDAKYFLSKYAITVEDERGNGEVTYIFDDRNYKRYKEYKIISEDAWRFSKLGALRLFNRDIKMTWKITVSENRNFLNIKEKFDPKGRIYEFTYKNKDEFFAELEDLKLTEKKRKEAVKLAAKEKKRKLDEEKQKLEQEKLEAQQKADEEKQKLEQEKLEAQQKADEEKLAATTFKNLIEFFPGNIGALEEKSYRDQKGTKIRLKEVNIFGINDRNYSVDGSIIIVSDPSLPMWKMNCKLEGTDATKFLNFSKGKSMVRVEVTGVIYDYTRSNGLSLYPCKYF